MTHPTVSSLQPVHQTGRAARRHPAWVPVRLVPTGRPLPPGLFSLRARGNRSLAATRPFPVAA